MRKEKNQIINNQTTHLLNGETGSLLNEVAEVVLLKEDYVIKNRSHDIVISGDNIFLRELNENDVSERYCEWLNDPEVTKYMVTRKTTMDELKQYIKKNRENKHCLFFGIFLKDTNQHIGNIKLEPINIKEKQAILGIMIGEKNCWKRGLGTEAVKLLINFAFTTLLLDKIELGVISEYKPAIRSFEKAGFIIDKTIPVDPKKYPNFQTQVMMYIKRNDFTGIKKHR
jgi:ribosomal-protein-alanine N-acetyltransferase